MSFTPIETQERLDEILSERIGRAKDSARKEFEGWISPEDFETKSGSMAEQIKSLTASLEEANGKIEQFGKDIAEKDAALSEKEALLGKNATEAAKIRIALEYGIPYEMADRLSGANKEEIRQDAERIAGFFAKSTAPMKSYEKQEPIDGVTKAFMELNPNIKL